MQIVIEIDDSLYTEIVKQIKPAIYDSTTFSQHMIEAIRNGKPLPDHGDLIDRDKLVPCCKFRGDCWADKCDSCSDYAVDYSDIKNATSIIGAERSDKDGDSD